MEDGPHRDPVGDAGSDPSVPEHVDDLRGVEAATAAAGWTIEYKQLDARPVESEAFASRLDVVSMIFERHSAAIECVGESPKGFLTLVVPEISERISVNGQRLRHGEIGIFGSGTETAFVARGRASAWNVHIPADRFVADREAIGLEAPGFDATESFFMVGNGQVGLSILKRLRSSSRAARSPLASAESASELIQEAVASVATGNAPRERSCRSHRVIRAAQDYIRTHLADPIRIPDVCRAAGTTQSTLERMFRSKLDVTPQEYVRLCRLDAAHRALRDPRQCDVTVTDVALRYGFTHLGRFAADYRASFGCLPHRTRRAPVRRELRNSG